MDSGGQEHFSLGNSVRPFTYQVKRGNNAQTDADDVLLAIVRGERPLADVSTTPFGTRAVTGIECLPLAVSASDIAAGIVTLKDDPAVLSDWANFILSAADYFEVVDENSEYWDRLIGHVWELAFGARLTVRTLALAFAVRSRRIWV